ncbi:MAG: hypothetical protein U0903_03660 [Planctomycetales bacterium]
MLNVMRELVKKMMSEGGSIRRRSRRGFSGDLQNLEGRQLLAAHVLKHGAVAAEVSVEKAKPAAATPGDFSGDWNVTTDQFNAVVVVNQTGNRANAQITIEDLSPSTVNVKIKGNSFIAKGQFPVPVPGVGNVNAKVKLTGTLDGPDAFHGTIAGKAGGQKLTIPYTAARKL